MRLGALAGAAALVFGVAVGGMTASTAPAAASTPVLADHCGAIVTGAPGAPITLNPSALLEPITNVLKTVDPLGLVTTPVINTVAKLPNIPVGAVPRSNGTISGNQVASSAAPVVRGAIKKIPLIGPLLDGLIGGLQQELAKGCTVLVKVVNDVTAPIQDGTGAVADTSKNVAEALNPGGSGTGGGGGSTGGTGGSTGPGAGGGHGPVTSMPRPNSPVVGGLAPGDLQLYDPTGLPYNFGRSPMADYASLPFAQPGVFSPSPGVRYGGSVPGYSPQFGILGGDNQSDGVQAAGHAESLDAPAGDRVALPVLLAVLALSGVAAALVRTWVLRRTIAS